LALAKKITNVPQHVAYLEVDILIIGILFEIFHNIEKLIDLLSI